MARYNSADVSRSAVLARLGAVGPASRAELARTLGVSPALITQLTKDLIADGLVEEREQLPSQGGRPARLLGLVSNAGRVVGVKVSADHLAFVESGLDGRVLRSASEPFDATDSMFLSRLMELIQRFIEGGNALPLLGVGVGVPGSVDRQGNGVVDSVQLGWNQVPVGDVLRRGLALPVIVENNVNALAVAERLYGLGRNADNMLVVTIGTGIGAAIVTDGIILRGGSGGAGEIGHIPVSDDGPLCVCGDHGCLESYIGEAALVARAREAGALGEHSGIAELRASADDGDERAARIFGEAGALLGRTIAGVVHTVDPELVVVLGEGTAAWRHWSFGFEPALRSHLMARRRGIPVEVETWQDDSWAQGAAALVLATPFDSEGVAGDQGRLVRERLVEQSSSREAGAS
ncbi:ROK family transcriptional regulator [Herbiconiux ginsengi]|uniref:Transcriptional regulator, MarR family n=1 Tax=Herbiconiux ginsengi TaxID=381665 RepID=A0A1H3RYN7_9MICO|nr:ROK family transcriptional regulator [Herbiconiux ginsengi]SDZ30812.1 transcriptional regulator, MarR family [Herbiconiux ginsengi]